MMDLRTHVTIERNAISNGGPQNLLASLPSLLQHLHAAEHKMKHEHVSTKPGKCASF